MGKKEYDKIVDEIFAEESELVPDGPVTDAYWDASPRILWVLKEAHADEGGWSLCDFLANNEGGLDKYPDWKKTFGKVAQVSWGMLNGLPR